MGEKLEENIAGGGWRQGAKEKLEERKGILTKKWERE